MPECICWCLFELCYGQHNDYHALIYRGRITLHALYLHSHSHMKYYRK